MQQGLIGQGIIMQVDQINGIKKIKVGIGKSYYTMIYFLTLLHYHGAVDLHAPSMHHSCKKYFLPLTKAPP